MIVMMVTKKMMMTLMMTMTKMKVTMFYMMLKKMIREIKTDMNNTMKTSVTC